MQHITQVTEKPTGVLAQPVGATEHTATCRPFKPSSINSTLYLNAFLLLVLLNIFVVILLIILIVTLFDILVTGAWFVGTCPASSSVAFLVPFRLDPRSSFQPRRPARASSRRRWEALGGRHATGVVGGKKTLTFLMGLIILYARTACGTVGDLLSRTPRHDSMSCCWRFPLVSQRGRRGRSLSSLTIGMNRDTHELSA